MCYQSKLLKHLLLLLGLCASCFFSATSQAQETRGFLLTPLNQTLHLRSGARTVITFKAVNQLPTSSSVNVKLRDVSQTAGGGPELHEPGTIPHSCATWLRTQEGTFSVAAGQTQLLTLNAVVPPGVAGSYHAALVVTFVNSPRKSAGTTSAALTNSVVLPIHIFITGTEKPAVALEETSFVPAERVMGAMNAEQANQLRGKWALVPQVRNTGNSMVRIKGDVVVTSSEGTLVGRYLVARGDPDGQPILPGALIRFPILLDSFMREPKYQARMNLDFPGPRGKVGYSAVMNLTPRVGNDATRGEVTMGTVERTGLQASASPGVLVATVAPGALRTERIAVTNYEDTPVAVNATALPCTIDTDGTPIALQDEANATWLSVAPSAFRLGAGQTRQITVRLSSAGDAQDHWALVQLNIASASPKTTGLSTTSRTIVVMNDATNTAAAGAKLQQVSLVRSSEGAALSLSVGGEGTRPATFKDSVLELVSIKNNGAKPVAIIGDADLVVLPTKTRRLDFLLPRDLAPGKYVGHLKLKPANESGSSATTTELDLPFDLTLSGLASSVPKPPAKKPTKAVAKPKKKPTPKP